MQKKNWRDIDPGDILREKIRAREKAERDEISRLETARREGERIGEARAEARGRLEGEARAKLEMVRGMLAAGIAREVILQASGLTEAELDSL